jgi:hypothetical protein
MSVAVAFERSSDVDDLESARELAEEDLEVKIAALGDALREYDRLTERLSTRLAIDLTRSLEMPINLHMTRAGLSPDLEPSSPAPWGDTTRWNPT